MTIAVIAAVCVIGYLLALLFTWALCRAAANGDRLHDDL